MKEINVNGEIYVLKSEQTKGEKLIIGIIDNRGLTYVGYSDLMPDDKGYIKIRDAQCIIRWWTGAHLNYLVNGVCEGVELGAKADILVSELYQVIQLPFNTVEEWKNKKISKGNEEVL